jgi:secreted trypsin-like serine protease
MSGALCYLYKMHHLPPIFRYVAIYYLIWITLFSVISAATIHSTHDVPVKTVSAKIFGGKSARESEFPFMAALYEYDKITCGGTIIAPQWIVTAAHCLVQPDSLANSRSALPRAPITALKVGVGMTDNTTEYPVAVKRTVVSPDYDPKTNTNDIALLELETPLTFNSTVRPAYITSCEIHAGDKFIALGWGFKEDYHISNDLQHVELEAADDEKCKAGFPDWNGQDGNLVCTGNTPGRDTCYGDSGGPLILPLTPDSHDTYGYYLVGITSFGIDLDDAMSTECGSENGVGYYTHVIRYIDWISETINQNQSSIVAMVARSAAPKLSDNIHVLMLCWLALVAIAFNH